MKAAYGADEMENLPKLNQEHPTLRLSQLKQLLENEWMKALENPFNKPTTAYNQGIHFKKIQYRNKMTQIQRAIKPRQAMDNYGQKFKPKLIVFRDNRRY